MATCFIIFVFGAVIGSFLNVCIYRLPRGESVVYPPSHCPHCQEKIRWFDNIPLLSFVLLAGRCRDCKKKISFRYFFVELITALSLLLLWQKFGLSWMFFAFSVFSAALIVIAFIDLEFLLIPDVISYPGIILGLLAGSYYSSFLDSICGLFIGGGLFFLISFIGQKIIRREVLGLGDVKMMAMIGAFLGLVNTFVTIFVASLIGSIVGISLILLKIKSRKDVIPFGPFLSLGALITLFWSEQILVMWEKLGVIIFGKFWTG